MQIGLDGTGASTTYANLAASFNNVGITADTNTAPGNFDGGGASFSETALTNAHAGPGASVTSSGVTFTFPNVAAGADDNTVAQGQKITQSGTGTLGFLVSASYGPAAGSGTLRTAIGPWEEFDLISNADGSVSFRAHANGDIVTADNAGANPLIANRTTIGAWEEFDLVHD